jgi:hypothetical protein
MESSEVFVKEEMGETQGQGNVPACPNIEKDSLARYIRKSYFYSSLQKYQFFSKIQQILWFLDTSLIINLLLTKLLK